MFEKEADYRKARKESKDRITKVIKVWSAEEEIIHDEGFQKGAEFGYNKANEWHYVKDGDLPKDNKEYLVLYYFNYRGKKEIHCGVRDNLHNDFEIHRCYTEQIIAWKEIVLPELKESR